MTNGDIIQARMFQRTMLSKTQTSESPKSKPSSGKDDSFSKVLSNKKNEKKAAEKSAVKSSDKPDKKEETKALKESETKPTDEKSLSEDEISKVEKVKVDEAEESKDVDTLDEEEMLNELTSLIEDLIHTLQLNDIVDKEKLQQIISDFEQSELNLDELKNVVTDLELITKDIESVEVSDKLVKIGQLLETLDLATTASLSNVPKELVENSKDVSDDSKVSVEEEVNNKNLSTEDEKATLVKKVEEKAESNVEENISKHTEENSEKDAEKDVNKKSETIASSDGTDKDKQLFTIKKDINNVETKQKDFDLSGTNNIQIDEFKGFETVNTDKTLENVVKTDMKIFNQIIEGAKINISEDVSEMLIKMKPDNLGKLSMKIVVDRGMLVARFEVESQIVKETIESNLEDLRNALKDKGFEIQQFDVSVNKDSEHSENYFSYFNKGKSKKMSIKSEVFANDTYSTSHQSIDGLTSTIDYLG
ncbi:flagellar hook-length control protein FliK [Wukongibacter baidiensis]|uniref:flagellar hook-length control protein FliK n=1 Tax=Wukongibacter baidiensis TaxID=1723361 RepID=UPI003D7F2D93